MKQYKEYTSIKKAIKKEKQEQLKKDLEAIKNKSKSDLLNSWFYRDLLTKKQQEKEEKELRQILADKLKKRTEKATAEAFEKCDQIAQAEAIKNICVSVDWVASRTWGNNPHAEVISGGRRTFGTASGCGYDKLSSAIAQAFNENPSILKLLYNQKEKYLRKEPNTSSREALGYGAGYGVAPYFEGGVGVSCFRSIFEKMGASFEWHEGKTWDYIEVCFK